MHIYKDYCVFVIIPSLKVFILIMRFSNNNNNNIIKLAIKKYSRGSSEITILLMIKVKTKLNNKLVFSQIIAFISATETPLPAPP